MTMASQGQPSRKAPSGPLLVHFLHPMHSNGSTWMRPKGGWSSSGTQNMQSSTGQYSTHAGEPAQPVQHSVITASSRGFFLRGVTMPLDRGSDFSSSGTMPGALGSVPGALAISGGIIPQAAPDRAKFMWNKHLAAAMQLGFSRSWVSPIPHIARGPEQRPAMQFRG